jgi:hypothetical protein
MQLQGVRCGYVDVCLYAGQVVPGMELICKYILYNCTACYCVFWMSPGGWLLPGDDKDIS